MARVSKKIKGISEDYESTSVPIGVALPINYRQYLEKVCRIGGYDSLNHLIKVCLATAFPSPETQADEQNMLKELQEKRNAELIKQIEEYGDLNPDSAMQNVVSKLANNTSLLANPMTIDVAKPAPKNPKNTRTPSSDPPVSNITDDDNYGETTFEDDNGVTHRIVWEKDRVYFNLIIQDEDGVELQQRTWLRKDFSNTKIFVQDQLRGLAHLWKEEFDLSTPIALNDFLNAGWAAFQAMGV